MDEGGEREGRGEGGREEGTRSVEERQGAEGIEKQSISLSVSGSVILNYPS